MGLRRNTSEEHDCPSGKGSLLRIREVGPAQRAAETNADVWTSEGRTNDLYDGEAPICEECWMAYLAPIRKWCRSLSDAERFRVPLAAEIRQFPIPKRPLSRATLVYNQLYGDGTYTESVGYWYERDDTFTAELTAYANKHALAFDLEPGPPDRQDQILVSASTSRRRPSTSAR